MWFDADSIGSADIDDPQDDRYPFYPVDTGHPIVAVMFAVCAVGLILVLALVQS